MMMNNLLSYGSQPMYNGFSHLVNIPVPVGAGETPHQPVSVRLKSLPFYDVHAALVTPTALMTRGANRFQTATYHFQLGVDQANQIALNRDQRQSAKINHVYQVQLRFCQLDTSEEQGTELLFPHKSHSSCFDLM